MKIVSAVAKILAALATAIGAIYLLATYGEQIVAWCKEFMSKMPTIQCGCDDEPEAEEEMEASAEEPAEDEEEVLEEVPVEEIPVEEPAENEVVADDADFAE